MKMREAHIVALSRQAIAVLRDIQPLTGSGWLVFPSLRTNTRPIPEGTLNGASQAGILQGGHDRARLP
jgi:hypothetical protein